MKCVFHSRKGNFLMHCVKPVCGNNSFLGYYLYNAFYFIFFVLFHIPFQPSSLFAASNEISFIHFHSSTPRSNGNEVMGDVCFSFQCFSLHSPIICLPPCLPSSAHHIFNGVNCSVLNDQFFIQLAHSSI